ncbi:ATP-grasp domain-containing protein [Winogradskyella alexanderae]|uniref:ATP-grasp domain-containing protein n=1 Tax=Winogradskyella alexanderae TaxID=2877123 RepID=A0ABS7XT78_9FLAO|nr:ATP-grasp domain-containing protein [Winogradskyella alexanderae]MCA0133235.1 ATP-grasp domain-containing protein [Winogradskyella alexanderae]
MYLIDKPYISDFLIDTIKENNFHVVATKEAKELVAEASLNWISEEEAIETIKSNPSQRIYSNSENVLSWIDNHFEESELSKQINTLKDKAKFREQIKAIFPEFKFQKIKLENIQNITTEELSFPFVIKPSIGFLSVGVYIIKNENDWIKAKEKITPQNIKSIFPKNVLDTSHFIIEDFIQGEEYAIDYYHNDKGEVVILNILHHVFSTGTDTSDRVYSTSKAIINQHRAELEQFLSTIGGALNLKNFPAHAEVRIDKNGKITPIEINPLRFGGWCTTGDLSGITIGLNSYKYYFENTCPNWDDLYQGKENKIFSIIVLDNNSGIKPANIAKFDYKALANDFETPILIRALDINKYPLFGFVFVETDKKNKEELYDILSSDLRKYIIVKE